MLQVSNISISFGGIKALRSVSFELNHGVNALIGPNGAGKTTLFNVISGFLKPDEGSIHFEGENITPLPPHYVFKKGISRTFQNLNLIKELTLKENIYLGILSKKKPSFIKDLLRINKRFWKDVEEKISYVMELTGIEKWADQIAGALPYGVLKNLELARALVSEPTLLLLDEPAAGLNSIEKENLTFIIERIKKVNISILMVEHDMSFVANLASYVVCLDFGEVIGMGTYEEIRKNDEVISAYLGEIDA